MCLCCWCMCVFVCRWQLRPASHRYDDADNKPQEGEEDHSSGCEYQYTGECVSPSRSSSTGTSTGYFLPPQVISIGPGQTKAVPLQLFPIDNYHSKGFGASDGSSWDKYSDMTEEDWLQDQLDREEMAATEGLGDDIPANDPSSGDDISSSSSPLGLLFARMLPCRRSGVVFNLIVTPSHGSQVQVMLCLLCPPLLDCNDEFFLLCFHSITYIYVYAGAATSVLSA